MMSPSLILAVLVVIALRAIGTAELPGDGIPFAAEPDVVDADMGNDVHRVSMRRL